MVAGKAGQALHSFSWLLAEKIVSLGGAAVVGILITRHLGPYDYGLQSYVITFATLAAAISGLGIGGVVTRELTYRPEEEDVILGSVSWLSTMAAIVVTLATAAWVFFSPPVDPRITWLIVLSVAANIFKRFNFLENWFIVHNQVRSFAMTRMTVGIGFILLRIILLLFEAKLEAFIITFALESAVGGVRALIAYRVATHHQIRWKFEWSISLELVRKSWPAFISGITEFVYLRVDVLLLTWWQSPQAAGVYSAAARLSEIWYFVPTLLMSALFPPLLRLRAADYRQYERRLQDVLDILAACGTMVAVFVTLAAPILIPSLYGREFNAATAILMIHIWAGVFVFMRAVLSKWLIAEELFIFSLVTHGAGAIINVAANYVLIPLYSGLGAAIATLISYATAGYLSLLLHHRTRPIFWMMTRSLLWPRRIPDFVAYARARMERTHPIGGGSLK
jgi:O-antigen/teichoic acid export membrane protein